MDAEDFATKLVLGDGGMPGVMEYSNDTEFMDAFHAIGLHYPCAEGSLRGQGAALVRIALCLQPDLTRLLLSAAFGMCYSLSCVWHVFVFFSRSLSFPLCLRRRSYSVTGRKQIIVRVDVFGSPVLALERSLLFASLTPKSIGAKCSSPPKLIYCSRYRLTNLGCSKVQAKRSGLAKTGGPR